MYKVSGVVAALLMSSAAMAQEVGPQDVIPPALQDEILECLGASAPRQRTTDFACFERPGVSEAARDINRAIIETTGYAMPGLLVGFGEAGQVDVAWIYLPGMANTNTQMALVNTTDGVLMVSDLNFSRTPADMPSTREILRRYPQAFESARVFVAAVRPLPGGAQRFVLVDVVTDGCRACEPVATSLRYFDFSEGLNTGFQEVGWQPREDGTMAQAGDKIRMGDVATMQSRLNHMGYEAGPVDGAAGRLTMTAVSAFKRDHCLPDDARVTDEFAALLTPEAHDFPIPRCAPGSATGSAPGLPFPDGVYSADARLCPPAPLAVQEEFGDRAYGLIVEAAGGNWHWGESICSIRQVRDTAPGVALDLDCLAEGMQQQSLVVLDRADSLGFSYRNLEFRQCQAPVAELPLPAGIYAHDPRLCPGSGEQAPNDVVFEGGARPLSIEGQNFSWDHSVCEITAARQAGLDWGLDLSCAGNNETFETTQSLSILSDTTVSFDGFDRTWCGPPLQSETVLTGSGGSLPVDLEEGVYTFDPLGCPEFDGATRNENQQLAANLRVTLREGLFNQSNETCPIASFTRTGDQAHLEMDCLYGTTPVLYRFEMMPQSRDGFQRYEKTYSLCTAPRTPVAPADIDPAQGSAEALIHSFQVENPSLYQRLAPFVDDDTLAAILVDLKIDIGDDYNAVWSSPVYQALLEGFVKVMLSPEVQKVMEKIGFPDTGYIYALQWPAASDVRSMGVDLAIDYIFDYAISVIETGLQTYDQPWDGGAFEGFFDAAIPASLAEAKFILSSLADSREGDYVNLAVGVFARTAAITADLHESARLFREVRNSGRETVATAVAGAIAALEVQSTTGLTGRRLPLLYARDLFNISQPLMNGAQAWTVDTGRKLQIISELVLMRSLQMQDRDISGYIENLNGIISGFEGTPISVWDSYANVVTFGAGGTREYSAFSRDVAIQLGVYAPSQVPPQ